MKSFMVLSFLSLALLIFMAYQAAVQEFSIRSNTARIKLLRDQEKAKESEIVSVKFKMQVVQTEINDLKKSEGGLKKQMEQMEKDKASALKSIETCKAQKVSYSSGFQSRGRGPLGRRERVEYTSIWWGLVVVEFGNPGARV